MPFLKKVGLLGKRTGRRSKGKAPGDGEGGEPGGRWRHLAG